VTPYLGYHLLQETHNNDNFSSNKTKEWVPDNQNLNNISEEKEEQEHKAVEGLETSWIYRVYNKFERPFLENSGKRKILLLLTIVLLLGSVTMFFTKSVLVKMLPFDNKNEFQVVIDMPEGTTLERTSAVTKEIAQYLSTKSEVVSYQNYIGTSAPITFNGLVRHYDMRGGSNMADIQVNLLHKEERDVQSHEIAKTMRPDIQKIAKKYGANVKLIEVPPGPPVLSTLVAEIYGPDYKEQIKVAKQVKTILENTSDIVDVDWMVEDNQTEYKLEVDKEKAMLNGIAPQQVVGNLTYLLKEYPVSDLYDERSNDNVGIVLSLDDKDKTSLQDIQNLKIKGSQGNMIPVSDLVKVKNDTLQKTIYRKDQKRVVYVTADMAGALESPVYAILGMNEKLAKMKLPKGFKVNELYMEQPTDESDFTVKWDGEWQITLEVFRDLGVAFMVVIVIIYMLIVGWFQNFKTPIVMMLAIPLSLIGIVLGHWLLNAYFTATSFIGMIALAGVMVRNSVLLIDFIEIRLNEGVALKQAIIEAGAVRTTPILLTTGAVVIGASIILFDPIFQGLAISLVFGAIISTILTLIVVPIIYYITERKKWEK
jgi:multidrug efflux pump subunit AcrB